MERGSWRELGEEGALAAGLNPQLSVGLLQAEQLAEIGEEQIRVNNEPLGVAAF